MILDSYLVLPMRSERGAFFLDIRVMQEILVAVLAGKEKHLA